MSEEQEIFEGIVRAAPLPSIRRMPTYLRYLYTLQANGRDVVSCTRIAAELGLVSVQVRKDLAITGIVGKPKIGYQVTELIQAIRDFLGWNNASDAFLVGAGCLGTALLGHEGFKEFNLNILAGFDSDPAKIGTRIHGKDIFPMEKLADLVERMHVIIAVLTVPPKVAQDVTQYLVLSGVRAIWNYTPVALEVPPTVIVEDVKLASSMAVLSSRLAEMLRRPPPVATRVVRDAATDLPKIEELIH